MFLSSENDWILKHFYKTILNFLLLLNIHIGILIWKIVEIHVNQLVKPRETFPLVIPF